jgi:hypothetical protein
MLSPVITFILLQNIGFDLILQAKCFTDAHELFSTPIPRDMFDIYPSIPPAPSTPNRQGTWSPPRNAR